MAWAALAVYELMQPLERDYAIVVRYFIYSTWLLVVTLLLVVATK
jgi:hypothetical protein